MAVAAFLVAPFYADAQDVESWNPDKTEPENKTVVLPSITAEFLDNTSKGSTAGAGIWNFTGNSAYVAADQNGCEIKFTPSKNGTLKLIMDQDIAANKSVNMFLNGDAENKMNAIADYGDNTPVTVISGVELGKHDPALNPIPGKTGSLSYDLKYGTVYNFFVGGTKYRLRSMTFTISADQSAGIEDVTVAEDENAPMYNLQGVQVDENYKGIVIKNGKKYLNK